MTEAQQKQILVCNLQQGKFNGLFEEKEDSSTQFTVKGNGTSWTQPRRNGYGSALANQPPSQIERNNPNAFRNSLNVTRNTDQKEEIDLKSQEAAPQKALDEVQLSSRKSSIDVPKEQAQSQLEKTKKEFEQMLLEILDKNNKNRKNIGAIDNLLP